MRIVYIPFIVLSVIAGRGFNAGAQTETNLYVFGGPPTDGAQPYAGLVEGRDGNYYGTTEAGGTNNYGTVFRISPDGIETNLYSFFGHPNDGASPWGGLVQGIDGDFYGTTYLGGTNNYGTVFRISPSGIETNLHSFVGLPTDGKYPIAVLVQGSDSNFYGTTYGGGSGSEGIIFRISPGGSFANLHSISGPEGNLPYAGLVQGSDGNFYGTTAIGGTHSKGNVFRVSPSGSFTNIHSFAGYPTDGAQPYAGLVQGSDGNFYGTTSQGGTSTNCFSNGCGTVFRISPNGLVTILHSFGSSPNDGIQPYAGLVQGSDGYFYGITQEGGTNTFGTVFKISSAGTLTTLYQFGAMSFNSSVSGGLVQGSDGSFYGTTVEGGTNYHGSVFNLTVPLSPPPYPINQITGVQLSGTNVVFNLVSIEGEIYQLQYSSSMNPTNWVNEGGTITSIGSLLTLTNFGGANQPQGFYRFAITP